MFSIHVCMLEPIEICNGYIYIYIFGIYGNMSRKMPTMRGSSLSFPFSQEFEAVKQNPDIRNPEAWMLKNSKSKGIYQGCFSESKWGGRRKKYNWDLFASCAQKMAKRMCEVPNVLRPVLNIKTLLGQGRLNHDKTGATSAPPELLSAVETMVVERVHAGEEVTRAYVKNVLISVSRVWNEHIETLREQASAAVGQWALKEADEKMDENPSAADLELAQNIAVQSMKSTMSSLQPYYPSSHPRAIEHLGFDSS